MKLNTGLALTLGFATVAVWGSTFISTKILLTQFAPMEIMFFRFLLAYGFMWIVYPRGHRVESWQNELKLLGSGIASGSLYFLAETFALKYSLASSVSLLVATAPILTALSSHFIFKDETLTLRSVLGILAAFIGVAFVIFNGKVILKLNPLGDILALVAALSWTVHSVIIKSFKSRYGSLYITRKLFFYTLLTLLPFFFMWPVDLSIDGFTRFADVRIIAHFLFLSLIASCTAYSVWNRVIWALGSVRATNMIYFVPLFTVLGSVFVLREKPGPIALAGAALVSGCQALSLFPLSIFESTIF